MKRIKLMAVVLLSAITTTAGAQKFSNAVDYLGYIGKEFKNVQNATWEYTRTVAKNKSAKKVAKTRTELIQTISAASARVKGMGDFQGNTAFRDSTVAFLELNKAVVSEDYEKIMNLEDIAEQSYDLMEAYLLAQEVAGEKLAKAGERISEAEKKFAADNQINLVDASDKTTKSLERAAQVYDYYNPVYLIFFKSYKQEAYFMEALNKGDVAAMEQNKSTLSKYAAEGLTKLESTPSFEGDASLKKAGSDMLKFYQDEADKKSQALIDFYTKKDSFEKTRKTFEAKKEKERTKEDVDAYNKILTEYNAAVNNFNAVNQELNNNRSKYINNWNNAAANFTNKHIN